MIIQTKTGKRRHIITRSRNPVVLPFVAFAAQAYRLWKQLKLRQNQDLVAAAPYQPLRIAIPTFTTFQAEPGATPSLLSRITDTVLKACGEQPEAFHFLLDLLSAYSPERNFIFDSGDYLRSQGWVETRFIASRMYVKITADGLAHIQTVTKGEYATNP